MSIATKQRDTANKTIEKINLDCVREVKTANDERAVMQNRLNTLDSYSGVQSLLQSILDDHYPPNTIVCADGENADTGAQLVAAARKIVELQRGLDEARANRNKALDLFNDVLVDARAIAIAVKHPDDCACEKCLDGVIIARKYFEDK